jgi:hypothetical protein
MQNKGMNTRPESFLTVTGQMTSSSRNTLTHKDRSDATQFFYNQIKKDKIGGACSTHRHDEECKNSLS